MIAAARTTKGGWQQLPSATGGYTDCPLRKLVGLYFVLAFFPGDWEWAGLKGSDDGKLLD
jgi:hypothetical protein